MLPLNEIPIESLPSTSPLTFKRLHNLGIKTYWDLLNHFPFRYENYSIISPIGQLQEGETVSIIGEVHDVARVFTKRGMKIQKATLKDETGKIDLIWFNQQYILSVIGVGMKLGVSGTVKKFGNALSITPNSYEILQSEAQPMIHIGRIVPIYPETHGLSSKTIREKTYHLINNYHSQIADEEFLPKNLIQNHNLSTEGEALLTIHFPKNEEDAQKAQRRLAFDELFTMQLSTALVKKQWEQEKVTNPFTIDAKKKKKLEAFMKNLPFELTGAQQRVTDEIIHDLQRTMAMNRFVQGDVGSGKTVVAAIAAYVSFFNGFQSLIMAPTEILAQQHFVTMSKLLEPYGIKIGLQTGAKKAMKKTQKDVEYFDIMIGTHALLTQHVQFEKVGLVVIDEQHRFGVAQRAILKQKGSNPHLLTMTATPIPRTVALTMYGQLDLSVIDEMPKGRLPIKTHLVPHSKRASGYEWIKEQMKKDKIQVYIICPLVEESEIETMQSIRAATKEYEHLKKDVFKEFSVALLHGKMKAKEKEEIMREYKEKKYDILVSTSVVEVGIDVPNATIMIIEGAERFGLAQLHQLRGRVGRGDKQSYCFLYTSSTDVQNTDRLNFFAQTLSGMALSEYDLKVRGPGQMYGKAQSGYHALKIANFSDFPLIAETKKAVTEFVEHYELEEYPGVKKRVEKYQIDQISRD